MENQKTPEPVSQDRNLDWELLQIRSTIRLVAFAVEAERVLREIEHGARHNKELDKILKQWTDARMQWTEYAGEAPTVLDGIHRRMGLMLGLDD